MENRPPPQTICAPLHQSRRLIIGVILATLLFQVICLSSTITFFGKPSWGFFLFKPGATTEVLAYPMTRAAAAAVARISPQGRPLQLLELNGTPVAQLENYTELFGRLNPSLRSPMVNTFLLKNSAGEQQTVQISEEKPDLLVVLRHHWMQFISHFVGLLYLAVGLFVWRRRPGDRAAGPLLMLCCIALTNLSINIMDSRLDLLLGALQLALLPLWGFCGYYLAIQFTGSMELPLVRRTFRLGRIVVLATAALFFVNMLMVVLGVKLAQMCYGPMVFLGGFETLLGVIGMAGLSWWASRQRRLVALRHRARMLGAASLISFLFPSVSLLLMVADLFSYWMQFLILISLSFFPIFIGVAIVHHQMFDLRIMLRRGVVSASLTMVVSLAYVGLVITGLRHASLKAPSPTLLAISAAVVVVVFSLLHVRVQRAVERFSNRARYLYADALAKASEALTRTRNMDDVAETLRPALIQAMGLSRAYFALRPPGSGGELRCRLLGQRASEEQDATPLLPEVLAAENYAPVNRALIAKESVTTHDSVAVAAQSNGLATKTAPPTDIFSEASFWKHFGVEAIVPLTLGQGEHDLRAVGLLVLGYKQNETPLTREDHEMLTTLANQLAVAVESSNAFDEIQRLNDGLEQQVKDRTRELSNALEELKEAQGQLIDSEMQATLGRLVAGILHELNTPLGTMHSSVGSLRTALTRIQPLLDTHPNSDQAVCIRARKALQTTEQLLSLIETSDGRIHGALSSLKRFVSLDEANIKPLDLEQSLSDALNVLGPSFGSAITVTTHFPPDPVVIHCTAARINKVFLNLLQNSANSIEERGEIRVTVTIDGQLATLTFEDNGRGISRDMLENIFDIGFTNKRGRVGLRLGLPSSKRWVEELGGRLEIKSEVGMGTTVKVTLPIAATR